MRAFRANQAYQFLQECQSVFHGLSPEEQLEFLFMPSKPKLNEGLMTLIDI